MKDELAAFRRGRTNAMRKFAEHFGATSQDLELLNPMTKAEVKVATVQ